MKYVVELHKLDAQHKRMGVAAAKVVSFETSSFTYAGQVRAAKKAVDEIGGLAGDHAGYEGVIYKAKDYPIRLNKVLNFTEIYQPGHRQQEFLIVWISVFTGSTLYWTGKKFEGVYSDKSSLYYTEKAAFAELKVANEWLKANIFTRPTKAYLDPKEE